MKKVFFGLSGGLGPVTRTLPIAEIFKEKGYEVSFSIYSKKSEEFIIERGFLHLEDTDPSMPVNDKLIPGGPSFYDLDHYFAQAGLLDINFLDSWVKHRILLLEEFGADLVFVDMSPHTMIAAKYLNIPTVSITQSCFFPDGEAVYSWGAPPKNTPKVITTVNQILKKYNLPSIEKMEDLNKGDLNIIPSIPEIDPVSSNDVIYAGPIEYPIPIQEQVPEEPYILVSSGRLKDSSGKSGLELINSITKSFSGKNHLVYIATEEDLPKETLSQMTPNIRIIKRFNFAWIKNSELFIHHGGHGSCLSSIMAGTPSLIIPTHTEREFNARKVCSMGVADYILPSTFTSEGLYKLCINVKNGPFRKNARKLRDEIIGRAYGGPEMIYQKSLKLINIKK
ncbi:glycosyltransferase [Cytobacillus praedii]|uniref:glycosyltransferase n=1 Tax=Cytobacillus praedii TaxID=1742358 RepID=UPI003F7D624E